MTAEQSSRPDDGPSEMDAEIAEHVRCDEDGCDGCCDACSWEWPCLVRRLSSERDALMEECQSLHVEGTAYERGKFDGAEGARQYIERVRQERDAAVAKRDEYLALALAYSEGVLIDAPALAVELRAAGDAMAEAIDNCLDGNEYMRPKEEAALAAWRALATATGGGACEHPREGREGGSYTLTMAQREAVADLAIAAGLAHAWLTQFAPDATINEAIDPPEEPNPTLTWVLDRAFGLFRASGSNLIFPEEEADAEARRALATAVDGAAEEGETYGRDMQ